MDGTDRYSSSSFAVSPEENRRNLDERQCETHQPLSYPNALLNAKDSPCKITEDVNGTYNGEDLDETEKELTLDTDVTGINLSLPMSLEEMDCGRISPIQERDVYPLADRFHRNAFGPRRNIDTEVIDIQAMSSPSQYPVRSSTYSLSLYDQHLSTNMIEQRQAYASHSADEYAISKDIGSFNSRIILDSSEISLRNHRELAENVSSNFTSLKEGNMSIRFSNDSSENKNYLAGMEKIGCPSVTNYSQKGTEIGIPNCSRDAKSGELKSNDRENSHTALNESLAFHGSTSGNNIPGFSWRMGKEKISLGECSLSNHCQGQGEPPMAANSLHLGWLQNVKKVQLPDSSLYEKSLENQRLKFFPISINNLGNSGGNTSEKNSPHQVNFTSLINRSEQLCKVENNTKDRLSTSESTQAIGTAGMEGVLPLHKYLEVPSLEENVESNLEVNYSERNPEIKLTVSDSHDTVISSVNKRQGTQINELRDETIYGGEYKVVDDFTAEKNLQFCEKVENVDLEEPSKQIKPEQQQNGKENLNEMESHFCSAAKNEANILRDMHSGGKTDITSEFMVDFETNATEVVKKEIEDANELDTSTAETAFRNEIDRLLDDFLARKEAELLSGEGLCLRGSGKGFENHFEDSRCELIDTAAGDQTDKGVIGKNVQSSFNLQSKHSIQFEKSTEVEPVHQHSIIKISGGEKPGVKNGTSGILMVNQEKSGGEKTAEIDTSAEPIVEFISKSIDSGNRQVEKDKVASMTKKGETCEEKVSDHLFNGVEVNFQDEKKDVEKPQTFGVCTPLGFKVGDDNGPNELSDSSNCLKERLESVSHEAGDNVSVENYSVNDFINVEYDDIGADKCVSMAEVGIGISEGVNAPNVAAVMGQRCISSNSIKTVQGNSTILKDIVGADAMNTSSPKTVISKELEDNTFSYSIGISEENQSELVIKTISVVNDKEDDRNCGERSFTGKVIPFDGSIMCLKKESFFCVSHPGSDKNENVPSQEGDIFECSSENNHCCQSEGHSSSIPENSFADLEANTCQNNDDGEVLIGTDSETNEKCTDENGAVSCVEIPEHGSNTLKTGKENKMSANKDSIMMVDNIALDNCLGWNSSSCEGSVGSYAKESLIQSQIASQLPSNLSYSKPINIAEEKNEEYDGNLINNVAIIDQPYASFDGISKLKENDFAEEKDNLCGSSSKDGLHDMNSTLGKSNCEDLKMGGKHDVGDEFNGSLELFAVECTLNDSLELNEMNFNEAPEEIINNEGGWFSSPKSKDYMISGIELIRDYSVHDSECLDSGNEIYSTLETDSGEENLVVEIQNIEGKFKTTGEYFPEEFSEIINSPSSQPSISISGESDEEDSDSNKASDSLSCMSDEYESIESDGTIESGTALKATISPNDIALSSELPSLSKICNFDGVDKENKISTVRENPALPLSSIIYHADKPVSSLIQYEAHHQKLDVGNCSPKLPSFTSLIKSICGEMHECNHMISSQLEEKKSECIPHDRYDKADFVHEKDISLKPMENDVFMAHGNVSEHSLRREMTTIETVECSMTGKVKNDDHQIVPDGTDNKANEEDYVPTKKKKLFVKAPDKSESEINRNINSIADDETSSFSLDLYLDIVVDKQLPFENSSGLASAASGCHCSKFVDAGCQTRLCGLLNTIHSCQCLETHLLSREKLDDFKFGGRKRELQALNLETLGHRNKKLKMLEEDITNEILSNDKFTNDEKHSEKKCGFDHQPQSSYFSHETKAITVNVYGIEPTLKTNAQLIKKLPENDWEEVCDVDEGMKNKEMPDQKVPDVEIPPDAGLEGRVPRMNGTMQDTNQRSMSSFSNIYGGSKVLRLGLSKRAKLPRLHRPK